MPTSDPYDILLSHNLWAMREVLGLCRPLTPEQFARPFPIGPAAKGGLHATISHILNAMGRWSDRIGGRTPRPPLGPAPPGYKGAVDDRQRTPDEFLAILDTNHADLAALAPAIRAEPARIIRVEFGGKAYTFTASCAYLHAITHGHYHRAQCMNMLRHLAVPGVSDKLPDIDVVDWQAMTEKPQP